MSQSNLPVEVISTLAATAFALPVVLGRWRGLSKWGSIWISTIVSPFLMLGATKFLGNLHWALDPEGGSGCSGGQCGADSYAAGLWPLLIVSYLPIGFILSWIVIGLIRYATD